MDAALNENEQKLLNGRVAELEKRTGAQIKLAVIGRSDVYAEIPWKGFALGVSVSAVFVFMASFYWGVSAPGSMILAVLISTLSAGVSAALLCLFFPRVARFFLDTHRAEVEVRQYAESFFLKHRLFATRGRTGLLFLISLFERRAVIMPDSGLARRLDRENLERVAARMASVLVSGGVAAAFEEGLKSLEPHLTRTAAGAPRGNEISDGIVEESGS